MMPTSMLVASFRHGSHQLLQSLALLLGNQPELGQVGAHRVDDLRALANQEVPRLGVIAATLVELRLPPLQ